MISIVVGWREHLFTVSYLTLVTDLDSDAIAAVKQWIITHNVSRSMTVKEVMEAIGGLVTTLTQRGSIIAVYTRDYGDFVGEFNFFSNSPGLETLYIMFDRDAGIRVLIGECNRHGSWMSSEEFFRIPDSLFGKPNPEPVRGPTIEPFDDFLNVLEE